MRRSRRGRRASIGLRPQVDQADRLNPLGAHLVELADALGLPLEVAVELLEARAPGAHVGFELAPLVVVEAERELLELRLGPRELLAHALALPLEGLAQVLLLALAALLELVDRDLRQRRGARLELGQELGDVTGCRGEKLLLDRLAGQAPVRFAERSVEKVERFRLGLARVGRERSLPLRRFDPARRERHQLLVEPLRAPAVERETAEQDHARDRVRGLREARAREVVVNEALRAEAGEQTLRHPLLEVQVDGVLGEDTRVLEDDRPDLRLAAPIGELLVLLAGRAERVDGGGPARVGLRAAVEPREPPDAVCARPGSPRWALRPGARGSTRGHRGTAPIRTRPSRGTLPADSGSARSAPSDPPVARGRPRTPPR